MLALEGRPDRTRSLAKAVAILQHVSIYGPTTLSEVARALGLTTSTAHRVLASLTDEGLLEQHADKRYVLSASLWETGVRSLEQIHPNLLDLSAPITQLASAELRVTTNLAMLSGADVLFVGRASFREPFPVYTPLADRMAACTTASGKALLAFQDEAIVDAVCEGELRSTVEGTGPPPADLRDELLETRRSGFAFNHGTPEIRRHGLAVPVLDADGTAILAIGASASAEDFTTGFRNAALDVLRRHALRKSMTFGYRGEILRQERLA